MLCKHEKLLHISFILKKIIVKLIQCMLDFLSYMYKAVKLNFLSSLLLHNYNSL